MVIARADRWLAIDKPSGLLSVPGRGADKADCARSRVRALVPEATGPLTVHRLDLETSGILLFGLDRRAHASLSGQFMDRKTQKKYVAVLDGSPDGDAGEVNLPIVVDWPNRPRKIVSHEHGKEAVTRWRVLERTETERGVQTRVEFVPITGRGHQLRVHAAWSRDEGGLGCPIAGDTLYGDADSAPRLLLHASGLIFWEPDSPNRVKLECPAPF